LTIERGAESTTVRTWAAGDFIEQRATAQTLYDLTGSTDVALDRDYLDEIILSLGGGQPPYNTESLILNKNKRYAPAIIEKWNSYYGDKVLCTITEAITGNVLADEIQFLTLADIVTWVNNNLGATTPNAVILKPYERMDYKIPQMTRMYGLNRFYSAIRGAGYYTSTLKRANNSKLDPSVFVTMFEYATGINLGPITSGVKDGTWISNSKKNIYPYIVV